MKSLYKHYKNVLDWNEKAAVKDNEFGTIDWDQSIILQTSLLVEEAQEAHDGIIYGNMEELLDGVVDSFVILSKLIDMLEKAGFDVESAIEAIQENNDKKVYNSYYEACEEKDKLELRDDVEYYVDTGIHNGLAYYTVKKLTGKVVKSVDFIAVDLKEFVPE